MKVDQQWSRLTREETDLQYNPTLWTRRLPTDELLPAHIEFTSSESEAYRDRLGDHLQTIAYGDGEYVGEMDVFRPETLAADAPIVFYVHGGWWQWFSKDQFSYLAESFNQKGFAVHMPGYRMAQDWNNEGLQHLLQSLLNDCQIGSLNNKPLIFLVWYC